MKRFLCPVDGSEESARAVRYATALAKELGATIMVVHVYERPLQWVPAGVAYSAELAGAPFDFERVKEVMRGKLEAICDDVRAAGVEAHAQLVEGPAAQAIADHAAAIAADVIVMSTHGRRGFDQLLLGSVTERVVRLAKCPVLTVRANAR